MPYTTLQLPPGLERNNTPYDTPNRWWDMSQVRWQSGSVMPIGGWQRTTSSPLDTPVRAFNVWRDNTAARAVVAGTDARLYVDSNGGYVDITPAGFSGPGAILPVGGFGAGTFGSGTFGTARAPSPIFSPYGFWSFGQWGEDLILTANTDGRLYYYAVSTPTTAPTLISEAPTGANACIVTSERHVMMIGSDGDPRQIAWSSEEDYTDWNFASTTNTAGFLDLVSKTPLLKAWRVAEGILVMSYTDVFLIRYIGQPYIYGGTDPIADTALFNPMSVATFGGKAAWPSRQGFQLYAGGYVQPLDCPIMSDILGTNANPDPTIAMDPTWGPFRMHGCHNFRFPELWWFYPSVGNSECNRYVVWNYEENWWGWGALARSAMSPADAYQYPYMGGTDGSVYQHEFGMLDNGQTRVGEVFLESGMLGVGASDRTIDINGMLVATGGAPASAPVNLSGAQLNQLASSGQLPGYLAVTASIIGRFTPQGQEYTDGPFAIRDDGYMDCRSSYRDARLRFDMAYDGAFSLGTIKLDAQPGTGR